MPGSCSLRIESLLVKLQTCGGIAKAINSRPPVCDTSTVQLSFMYIQFHMHFPYVNTVNHEWSFILSFHTARPGSEHNLFATLSNPKYPRELFPGYCTPKVISLLLDFFAIHTDDVSERVRK